MNQYDFIAIGDTVTDAFIRLADASAHIEKDHGSGREICMRFGDKIPYVSSPSTFLSFSEELYAAIIAPIFTR